MKDYEYNADNTDIILFITLIYFVNKFLKS